MTVSWTCCDGCLSRDDVEPVDTPIGTIMLCGECRDPDQEDR